MPKIKVTFLFVIVPLFAFLFLSSSIFAEETKTSDAGASSAPAPAPVSVAANAATVAASPAVPAADATSDEQSSYVYDLKKLIEKSKDNIKRVNEKIQEQAIYKRNQQREEKSREYYERAIQLFEEGKPDEAREYWEKSIKITEHPEMKNYIKGSEKRFKLQASALKKEERGRQTRSVEEQKIRNQQVEEDYTTAVALYKQKKYKPAREEFILVEQLIPEYKATRSYLKLLDQNIAVEDQEDKKNQQKEIAHQQEEAEAARVREKEMWRKEIELKEQERRAKLTKQAQNVYKEATALYNKKDFVGAKEKFQEVEWVIPDYKSTRNYLDKLDADIKKHESEFGAQKAKEREQEGWREELARKKLEAQNKKELEEKSAEERRQDAQEAEINYLAAVKLMEDKKYADARDKFLEVQKVYPDYKATVSYLSRLNQKLGIIENAPDKVSDEVKEIYADAVRAYKSKDYAVAKMKFERVEFMYPNYEATRRYLGKLDKDFDVKRTVATDTEHLVKNDAGPQPTIQAFSHPGVGPEDKGSPAKALSSEDYDKLVSKAEPIYTEALALYEAKKFDESLKNFQSVEDMLPNYKSTRPYLKRVNQQIKKVEQQRYKEEQIKQAETINILAKQANSLFLKIQQLSDDSATSSAKKKFAMVDRLFANLSKEQAKLLADILEEEKKLQLEEVAYEQEVQKSEFANMIDPIYNEAVRLYQARQYDEAKAKFLEAQSKLADYRSSSRYLALIDKQNQLLSEVMNDRENRIKDYQVKADENAKQAAKMALQAKEQTMIKDLVAQAESINDEIVSLSKDRNFDAIKAKFAELEKIVDNLLMIKGTAAQRDQAERAARKSQDAEKFRPVTRSLPVRKASVNEKPLSSSADTPVGSDQPAGPEAVNAFDKRVIKDDKPSGTAGQLAALKAREESKTQRTEQAEEKQRFREKDQQNRNFFNQAIQDFESRHYSEAKIKFLTLEQQPGYSRASRRYIDLIDRLIMKKQKTVQPPMVPARNFNWEPKPPEAGPVAVASHPVAEELAAQPPASSKGSAPAPASTEATAPATPKPSIEEVHITSFSVSSYLDSLGLRGRRAEPQVVGEQQISNMKEIPVEPKKKAPEPAPAPPQAPVVEAAAIKPDEVTKSEKPEASQNENGSWFKRRQEKALLDKRKKYLEAQAKAAQKEKEAQDKVKDIARQHADDRFVRRQRAREIKNRTYYERELKLTSDSGTDRAIAYAKVEEKKDRESEIRHQQEALHQQREGQKSEHTDSVIASVKVQEKKDKKAEIRHQQEILRQQREGQKAERKDKERQISSIVTQSQNADIPNSHKELTDLRAAQLRDKTEAKPRKVATVVLDELPELKTPPGVSKLQPPPQQPPPRPIVYDRPRVKETPPPAIPKEVSAGPTPEQETMRKQFESGVEVMYSEALSYYKSRMYKEARDKFADVEDLLPNYKKTRSYLQRSDKEILNAQKRNSKESEQRRLQSLASVKPPPAAITTPLPAAAPIPKKDAVSDALDTFETQSP
jgi:TolA-binding protein